MNRSRLFAATVSVSALRLVGQFTALFSGLLIASYFGAGAATDDYYTALILPAALANLIINALTNLFAPIYLQHVHDQPDEGPKILSSLMFVVLAALAAATLISLLAVPLYTATRDLPDAESLSRALVFGFILVVNCPLVGYVRLLSVYTEAHQHYNIPAVSALISPIVFIVTLLLTLSLGTYALLIANVTSVLSEVVLLSVFARRLRLRLLPSLTLHPVVREMLRAAFAPGLAYLALFFVPTVDRLMAASLDPGSLTAFHYGERLVVAFEALVLGGPLLVIYYHWANVNANQGIDAVAQSVPEMISLLNFVMLPLCVLGAFLSYPIISILFGRGAFTAVETSAQVFAILLLSQAFNFLIVLLMRLLLLLHLVRVQLLLSVGVTVLNIALNSALIVLFSLQGIVLSTLLTRLIIAVAAAVFVKRYMPQIDFRITLYRSGQTLLSITVMVGVLFFLNQAFAQALERTYGLIIQIAALLFVAAAAGISYLMSALLFRHGDLSSLLAIIERTRFGLLLRRIGLAVK